MYFTPPPPADGVPFELGIGALSHREMGLPDWERSLTMFSAIWIQYTNVTDRRTDGHRATAKSALTYSVARWMNEWMNEWMNDWMLCKCCAHAVEQIHVKSTTNRKERNKLTVHIHVSRCCGFSCGHFNKSVTIRHNVVWVLRSPITYSSSGRMIWGIVSRGMLSISSSSGKPAVSAQVGGHV